MTQLLSVCCFNSALRDVSACSSLWPLPVRNELSEAHRRDWMIRRWEVIPLWVRHDCGIWCSVFSHFLVMWIRSTRSGSTDSFVPESVTAVHLCNRVSYFLFVLLDKKFDNTKRRDWVHVQPLWQRPASRSAAGHWCSVCEPFESSEGGAAPPYPELWLQPFITNKLTPEQKAQLNT